MKVFEGKLRVFYHGPDLSLVDVGKGFQEVTLLQYTQHNFYMALPTRFLSMMAHRLDIVGSQPSDGKATLTSLDQKSML